MFAIHQLMNGLGQVLFAVKHIPAFFNSLTPTEQGAR